MLYYSTPSPSAGHRNPDISMPYAFLVVDIISEEIVYLEKKVIDDTRQSGASLASFQFTPEEMIKLRQIYEETVPDVFSWYWEDVSLSKKQIEIIKGFIQMNEILMEAPLVGEYRKINPHFFEWLKKNQ
jgi:hypothetical protein